MADSALIIAVRTRLEDERVRLRTQIAEVGGERPALDGGFADSGQVAAVNSEHLALFRQLHDQLAEVDRALGKLDDGTYGRCETCGEPIPEARLEFVPATRFCIAHA
jgi:RNA polymerase-binding transcription factor DksA